MAAGDNIAVTLKTLTAYNTEASLAAAYIANAATADTDALAQPYTILPTKANSKGILICKLAALGTGVAGVTYSIAVGANGMKTGTAKTGTLAKDVDTCIPIDGKYIGPDGKIAITFTPGASDKMVTDHAFTCVYIELV
jgi:hypothetical protein